MENTMNMFGATEKCGSTFPTVYLMRSKSQFRAFNENLPCDIHNVI